MFGKSLRRARKPFRKQGRRRPLQGLTAFHLQRIETGWEAKPPNRSVLIFINNYRMGWLSFEGPFSMDMSKFDLIITTWGLPLRRWLASKHHRSGRPTQFSCVVPWEAEARGDRGCASSKPHPLISLEGGQDQSNSSAAKRRVTAIYQEKFSWPTCKTIADHQPRCGEEQTNTKA